MIAKSCSLASEGDLRRDLVLASHPEHNGSAEEGGAGGGSDGDSDDSDDLADDDPDFIAYQKVCSSASVISCCVRGRGASAPALASG